MYSKIASIYNIFLWQEFSQDLFERIEIFLYEWKVNTHLDIACGTGEFVYLVKKMGIDSSGIDISEEMILKAKKNYPQIYFKVADMKKINLKKKVDLITCNFDSINHLLKFIEWEETFSSVYENLSLDGRFLFDINTLELINKHKEKKHIEIDNAEMNIEIYTKKKDILIFDIKARIKNEKKIAEFKEIIRETSFEYKQIKKSLKRIGFSRVAIFNKKLGIGSSKNRKFIIAQK